MKEKLNIAIEIFKNIVMSNPITIALRNKLMGGRTTGSLEVEKAVQHSLNIFSQYNLGLKDAGLGKDYFSGKSIMQIGPGANLGVELQFIGSGAIKSDALDRFADVQNSQKEIEIYSSIVNSLKEEAKQKCSEAYQVIEGKPVFKNSKINYFGECALETAGNKFNKNYDVVCSHLALEHVADLEKGIASTTKILKPGGICIYICNLVSLGGVYNHQTQPLRLLYYSDSIWQLMFSNRGGSNRVRMGGYKTILEKNNFKILSLTPLQTISMEALEKIKPHFDSKFKNIPNEELQVLKFRVVAQLQ
jgi:SAM-dependent methyltransferase